jgi:hypothetical protein
MQTALRKAGKSRSSALYFQLAEQISFNRCIDPAFIKLKSYIAALVRQAFVNNWHK